MKLKNIKLIACLMLVSGYSVTQAQTATGSQPDTIVLPSKIPANTVDLGLRSEKAWRTTGAVFTITGEELARTNAGNLLNTLPGRIPGLTVATGSGEPG